MFYVFQIPNLGAILVPIRINSGLHRLFEGKGENEGTLARVLAPKTAL